MYNIFKRGNIAFFIALLFIIFMTLYNIMSISVLTIDAKNEDKVDRIKILIDPGHGGVDLGASGDLDVYEAPINLQISKKLMSFLEGSGIEVAMTRYDENGLYTEKSTTIRAKKNEDLANRVDCINESDSDLVVSIHLNAFPQEQYYGAHVFYKEDSEKSKLAAQTIQNSMKEILDKSNERVPQVKKNIKILDDSKKPTILIECGFLSNDQEARKLATDEYQEHVAWSIYIGLMRYFNKL